MYRNRWLIISSISTVLFVLFIALKLYARIGAFGCFDDCHTITSAHFMMQGRELYAEIFYNHQPLMPIFSYVIQSIMPTESLYQLIAVHRIALLGISLLLGVLLIVRFTWIGIMFLLIYEPIKFYLHGDRFLPESLVAYLVAYLTALVWEKFTLKKLPTRDMYLAALMTWLIVFLREPYVPLAGVLFAVILFNNNIRKIPVKPVLLFSGLTIATLLLLPLRDYYETVFVLNFHSVAEKEIERKELLGTGLIELFLYPATVIRMVPQTIVGHIQMILSWIIIAGSFFFAIVKKQYGVILIIWLIAGISAIRMEPPGAQFYEAFHMIPWYAVMIISAAYALKTVNAHYSNKIVLTVLTLVLISMPVYAYAAAHSFLTESVDSVSEFNDGYARYQTYSDIIKLFSDPDDTLFVDLWDEILYETTELASAYSYALYTPWNRSYEKYADSHAVMFAQTPPDFYYCSDAITYDDKNLIPEEYRQDYVQLSKNNKPVCIFIHSKKYETISEDMWNHARDQGVTVYRPEDDSN